MSDFRMTVSEIDKSSFINTLVDETGAMVVKSRKGNSTPMKIQTEEDALMYLGKPSAEYPEVFEAIAYTRAAPLWVSCAIGTGALTGGVDVGASTVTGFGLGRDIDTFSYSAVVKGATDAIGTGTGAVALFSGTIAHTPIVDVADFKIKVAGTTRTCTMANDGTITGSDVTGTVNLTSGVYSVTFTGVVGTLASVTTDVDGSTVYDLSSGATDKYIEITIDGTVKTINLGQSATTTRTDIITAINTEFGFTAAATSGNFIAITGRRADVTGIVTVDDPSTGSSALVTVFNSGGVALTDSGTAPTGMIPTYGQAVTFEYHYTAVGSDISHSFFSFSPCVDDLAISVKWNSGSKFTATLYQLNSRGTYGVINSYDYSLIRENDGFGKSLYFDDVFYANPYIKIKVNSTFTGTYTLTGATSVPFTGGSRGASPVDADYTSAWDNFKLANKYKAKVFMDAKGNSAVTLNTIIQTYQPWAQGITVVPIGNNPAQALSFRTSLALDTDDVCLYHNWTKIQDDYNNSAAWISNIGSIGKKYAWMADTYDAGSPAGPDESGANMHGGQLQDWKVLDVENDFSDSEMQSYYNAQINPIVLDEFFGLMARGDQTLQVSNSDTSFVGTRRVYKYMIDVITKQILVKQEFKLNDAPHRLNAKNQIDDFVNPIKAAGWIRDFKVVCDSTNNTDTVLNNRQFVVDFYVKITPNSQFIKLNLIRLAQGAVLAS